MGTGTGNGKWEIRGETQYRYRDFYGLNKGFVGLKAGGGTAGNCTGFPKYREPSLSYTISPRKYDRFDLFTYIIYTVPYYTRLFSYFFTQLSTQ